MRSPVSLLAVCLMLAVALLALGAPAYACDYGGGVPASGILMAPAYSAGCGVPAQAPAVYQAPAVVRQRVIVRQRAFVPSYGYGAAPVLAAPAYGTVPVGAGGINVNVGNGNQSQRRGLLRR